MDVVDRVDGDLLIPDGSSFVVDGLRGLGCLLEPVLQTPRRNKSNRRLNCNSSAKFELNSTC